MFFDPFIPRGKQQKKLQDHEEYMAKKELLIENEKLTKQLKELSTKCDLRNNDLLNHFIKSSTKETHLREYVDELTDKLFEGDVKFATEYDKKICELHSEIILTIENIQEKVKKQIEKTKGEMEKELGERFAEAEVKQRKLMDVKVDQQKKVFDRMNYTKNELEKIVKKFAETNSMCEKLAKENDKLKLDLETSINLNKLLEKQLMKLQKENDRVEADYNQIANNLIEENSNNESQNLRTKLFNKDFQQKMKMNKNNIKPLESFKQNKNQNPYKIFESIPINSINKNEKAISSEKLNNLYTDSKAIANEKSDTNIKKKIVGRGVSANTFRDNLTPNQLEIKNLKIELEKTQKEYNKIYKKYIESQKIKTDAQQLLQKCIEDVQIQLSQTNTKYNELIQSGKQNEEETNDVMSLKKTLEQKLKVLTFIYDNGIQNLKSHKTGLFYKK
jgi:hypothetical protein